MKKILFLDSFFRLSKIYFFNDDPLVLTNGRARKEFSRGAFAPQLGFVDTEVSAGHFHPLTTLHKFGVYLELVEKNCRVPP